ncbi:hypothetical protein DSO57_1038482 [Entomophthora muscae]|uniref:Uncharacterized protein n=1 Tax=Entomophthora muscae TaxID=34485 RepID=A0ACC2TAJ2_9FUNG|nr:hypothetical protein DSO57_1038482 [Entomophthora muscae]
MASSKCGANSPIRGQIFPPDCHIIQSPADYQTRLASVEEFKFHTLPSLIDPNNTNLISQINHAEQKLALFTPTTTTSSRRDGASISPTSLPSKPSKQPELTSFPQPSTLPISKHLTGTTTSPNSSKAYTTLSLRKPPSTPNSQCLLPFTRRSSPRSKPP